MGGGDALPRASLAAQGACYAASQMADGAATTANGTRALGPRRKVVLWALLVLTTLLMARVDAVRLTPATTVGAAHSFSILRWEVVNLPDKWANLVWETVSGGKPSREERRADLDEYLKIAQLARKEEKRLEGLLAGAAGLGGGTKEREASRDYLDELLNTRGDLRPSAEEAIEAELDRVIKAQGLAWWLGITFPPVDIRFEEPPTILITSRRDRLLLLEAVLLEPDLEVLIRDDLENRLLDEYDVSGLVDNLAGLSTYPSLVSDLDTLRGVLQTAAHEWLHAYFFFRPLGWNIRRSETMFSLNETIADVAGRELGDLVFVRMGGDLSISSSRYSTPAERDPVFTREMRETRRTVEELLAEGKVVEAEEYMKERWWDFRLAGYGVRKLNQAYLAFRGRYAEGPASVSPIGDQVNEMRDYHTDVGSFIKTVAKLSSYQEFLDALERFRAQVLAEQPG
jgi:hypothetical protein